MKFMAYIVLVSLIISIIIFRLQTDIVNYPHAVPPTPNVSDTVFFTHNSFGNTQRRSLRSSPPHGRIWFQWISDKYTTKRQIPWRHIRLPPHTVVCNSPHLHPYSKTGHRRNRSSNNLRSNATCRHSRSDNLKKKRFSRL